MVKLMGITNLTFSNKEKLIFIEIGWGEKIKKSILGMDPQLSSGNCI